MTPAASPAPIGRVTDAPLVGSPQWRLFQEQGYLVATAGADDLWVVDDVPGSILGELAACWSDAPPTRGSLSPQASRAVEQLQQLGAVWPQVELPASPTVGVAWVGKPSTDLDAALRGLLPVEDAEDADLLLVVRTSGSLRELVDRAPAWVDAGRPHLLVDVAARATITLGPLVLPGHTSCLACLGGRVGVRWGDPVLPSHPGASVGAAASVVAGLVAHQVSLLAAGDFGLANRTRSLGLDTLESQENPVLRSASCPVCGGITTDGCLELPWA